MSIANFSTHTHTHTRRDVAERYNTNIIMWFKTNMWKTKNNYKKITKNKALSSARENTTEIYGTQLFSVL